MASEVARAPGIYIVYYIIIIFFLPGLDPAPGVGKSGRIWNKKAGSGIQPIMG